MAKIDKSNLGYLGEEFQYRLIHTFMSEKEFFKDICSIVNQNMFTDPNLKVFVGTMIDYYNQKEAVPSYELMGILLNSKARNEIDRETYSSVLEKIKNTKSDGVEYIQEQALRFFRQQNFVKAANEILKIAADGDSDKYQQCVDLMQEALTQGLKNEYGSNVFENLTETLSDDYRVPIPTGIKSIDVTLEGGLGKGELGVIIGSSSFGKTSMTTAMASYAATYKCPQNNYEGFKVLQIVFEDRIKQIQRKHLARIVTQTCQDVVEAKDLSKPDKLAMVLEQVEKYPDKEMLENNLRIVRFPSGELTAQKIGQYIKKMINNGFKPDMAIIDYFECLAHIGDSATNEWEKEGKTMRKFESLAGDLDMAIWIPVQGTKDSVNLELVTMDKAGGSFKKIQIAHIVMSIARTIDDIEHNKATIAILKNRAGQSGKVFNNVYFNNGTCTIEANEDDEDGLSISSYNERANFSEINKIFKQVKDKKNMN